MTEAVFNNLLAFSEQEKIALNFYEKYGEEMDFAMLLYLEQHNDIDSTRNIVLTPEAVDAQKKIRDQFRQSYHIAGLTEQDFLRDDENVEVERLLRYIMIPEHKHAFFEITCVLHGECIHKIDTHVTRHIVGDFTIIPPNVAHELHASADCVCLTIKVRRTTFANVFARIIQENSVLSSYFTQILSHPHYRCALSFHCGDDYFLHNQLLLMYDQQLKRKIFSNDIIEGLLIGIFPYLLQNYQETAEYLETDAFHDTKMIEVLNYVFQNYQNITLTDTARHFNLSVPYLSTKIRETTGKTFSELLRTYRLERAAELLVQTDLKNDEICERIGYKDTAQFISAFKSMYLLTPKKYRKAQDSFR